jgi:formylglycine-generating enzyme required for sulfatase activity
LRWEGFALVFKERFEDCDLPMVRIPAGDFWMGSADVEEGYQASEGPRQLIQLEEFLIGRTPITQAQWRMVAQWRRRPGETWTLGLPADPSRFQPVRNRRVALFNDEANCDHRPVECISWHQAMQFCHRLSERTGRTYTLPSEAQWEYACKAGTTKPFAFGDSLSPELANVRFTNPNPLDSSVDSSAQTTPVAMFPANAWGLHDMHGNVREWCLDDWRDNLEGAPPDGHAWRHTPPPPDMAEMPEGQKQCKAAKVVRGGSWFDPLGRSRSASRSCLRADRLNSATGFRVVCLPPQL